MKPTVILVHGAYADSSSWSDVIPALLTRGHRVVAWANPLRGVAADAAALSDLVYSLDGPVVLVGHSYGGAGHHERRSRRRRRGRARLRRRLRARGGESHGDASSLAPGSTLAETLDRVPLAGGGVDTYIAPAKFHEQFAADLPAPQSALMAVVQRPITEAALFEPSGEHPLWRTVPSWFVFGELDRNIPAGAQRIMADRAGAKRTVEIAGASHVVGISHPARTAELVLEAAHLMEPDGTDAPVGRGFSRAARPVR